MSQGSLTEDLGLQWNEHYARLRAQSRVLIVDGDQTAREIIEQLLFGEGYRVEKSATLSDAWVRLGSGSFDLLMIEKELTDGSGMDLVTRMREKGIEIPFVICTSFPSVSGMSKAIGAGASDYIAKPFADLSRLLARLQSLLEVRITERLYTRISGDLASLVPRGTGHDDAELTRIRARLFDFKRSLATRPSTLILESSGAAAELAQNALTAAGISSEAVTSFDVARERLRNADGPLSAVVSLKIPGAVDFLGECRRLDPLIEIVATTSSPEVDLALAAIEAGAADVFYRSDETMDALQVRVKRAVKRSRRQRLHINLVSTLWQEAQGSPGQADQALALVPPALRSLVTREPEQAHAQAPPLPSSANTCFIDEPGTPPGRAEVPEHGYRDFFLPPKGPVRPTARGMRADLNVLAHSSSSPHPSAAPSERRREARYSCSLPVELRPLGEAAGLHPCQLTNISAGGMFIHLPAPPPVGTRLEIRIDTRDLAIVQEGIDLVAKVVRAIRVDPDPYFQTGVGVCLLETSPEMPVLTSYLASLGLPPA